MIHVKDANQSDAQEKILIKKSKQLKEIKEGMFWNDS